MQSQRNTYKCFVYMLNVIGKEKEAKALVDTMEREGIPPNVVTYSTLFSKDLSEVALMELGKESEAIPHLKKAQKLVTADARIKDIEERLRRIDRKLSNKR